MWLETEDEYDGSTSASEGDKCANHLDDTAEEKMSTGTMDENEWENPDPNAVHDAGEEKVTITIHSRAAVSTIPKR